MKYIRTKDGIYEVVREIFNGKAYEVKLPQSEWWYDEDNKYYYEDSKFDSFHKREVITEADTIEELCDEFVFVMGESHNVCKLTYEQARDNILTCELENMSTLYGAIWTNKGLIYVAKMNEKGELELL